jgi:hypothetical protein
MYRGNIRVPNAMPWQMKWMLLDGLLSKMVVGK